MMLCPSTPGTAQYVININSCINICRFNATYGQVLQKRLHITRKRHKCIKVSKLFLKIRSISQWGGGGG